MSRRLVDLDLSENKEFRLNVEDIRRNGLWIGFVDVTADVAPYHGRPMSVHVEFELWSVDGKSHYAVGRRTYLEACKVFAAVMEEQGATLPDHLSVEQALPCDLAPLLLSVGSNHIDGLAIGAMQRLNSSVAITAAWEVGERIREAFNTQTKGAQVLQAAVSDPLEGVEFLGDFGGDPLREDF